MNDLMVRVSTLGGALVHWALGATAWCAVVLAAVFLADFAARRRVRAAWRLPLYAAVGIRAALPLSWGLHLPADTPAFHVIARVAVPATFAPIPIATASANPWLVAAALAYLCGLGALLVVWTRARLRLRRALRDARLARAEVRALAPDTPLLEHATLGPLVAGVLRPVIVLPAGLVDLLDAEGVACIVGHERAHVVRRDPIVAALVQLTTFVAWPIVPVWIAAWRVRRLVEIACDEAAIGALPGKPGGWDVLARRRYGEVLLRVAEWAPLGPPLAPRSALHFGEHLAARVQALKGKAASRWSTAWQASAAVGAAAAVGACASVSGAPTRWTPPAGEATLQDVRDICHFAFGANTQAVPPDRVAWCQKQSEVISEEAYDALGQMGKDIAAAFEKPLDGKPAKTLCPSAPPIPAKLQNEYEKYQPNWPDEWNVAGWQCMRFSMNAPMFFQYQIQVDEAARSFEATARARLDGKLYELSHKGAVVHMPDGEHVLVEPNIEVRELAAN